MSGTNIDPNDDLREFDPIDIDPIEIDLDFSIVNFRIVGVYFGSVPGTPPDKNTTGDITLVVPRDPTVKQVVERAKQEADRGNITGVSSFDYNTKTLQGGGEVLDEVEVTFTQPPKKNRQYPSGTYSLRQDLDSDPQQVFQYYIYSRRQRQGEADELLRKNTDNSFRPFDQNQIEHGDYLVWRLVSIRQDHDLTAQDMEFSFDSVNEFFDFQRSQSPLKRKVMEGDTNAVSDPDLPDPEAFPTIEEIQARVEENGDG